MTQTTKQLLITILGSDATVGRSAIAQAISVLEGGGQAEPVYTRLISKSKAAKLIGCSRTTLYEILGADAKSPKPMFKLPRDGRTGLARLRECDVVAYLEARAAEARAA